MKIWNDTLPTGILPQPSRTQSPLPGLLSATLVLPFLCSTPQKLPQLGIVLIYIVHLPRQDDHLAFSVMQLVFQSLLHNLGLLQLALSLSHPHLCLVRLRSIYTHSIIIVEGDLQPLRKVDIFSLEIFNQAFKLDTGT